MRHILIQGMRGAEVLAMKRQVARQLGAGEAAVFPGLVDGKPVFDADTQAAVLRWQAGVGLIADGVVGPRSLHLLGLRKRVPLDVAPSLAAVRQLFPQTKPSNIVRYLPYVTCALEACGLTDKPMVLAALGTIRAETAGFVPISEYPSRFNTVAGRAPFSAYEPGTGPGKRLGNQQVGDGARFRGRGFVQLTGRYNYTAYGAKLGLNLALQHELANTPEVAAMLLATYLAAHAPALRAALALRSDAGFAAARKLVNGGSHGLQEFRSVFDTAALVWPDETGAGAAPAPASRKSTAPKKSQKPRVPASRDTHKDPVDLRDRLYQPPPLMLPDVFPPEGDVKNMFKDYRKLVLDQGEEGACTGFGLACVINFARWQKSGWQASVAPVSPRMLFNFARRYDEYAGEDYEYSSCRGALKGWFHHGVCLETDWPYDGDPRYGYVERAADISLGVYYRIDIKAIVDMQTAILQTHAIFVSAFTHEGWDALMEDEPSKAVPSHEKLPVIAYSGRPSRADGHAFALVGFNATGFIVQNSWGGRWGVGGFAVLTYADWLANGMDAWVASLGVSGVTQGRLAGTRTGGGPGASARRMPANGWSEDVAYAHSLVFGDDGRVSRYVTQDETSRSLQYQACSMPDAWFRTDPVASASKRKRLVIYAHGGLNSEAAGIQRASAMGRYFAGNGCYPLFLVWKTGLLEAISDILAPKGPQAPVGAAGISGLTDAVIEKTLGRGPVRRIWSEMKQNAAFSCEPSRGADLLVTALKNLVALWGDALEIHLVGHSAGAILLGHLLDLMSQRGLINPQAGKTSVASVHLYAPACTVQFANRYYAPHRDLMQAMFLDILSDGREQDDNTAYAYRKSLLYLVSNAAEPDVRTPLLGLCNARDASYTGWDGSSSTSEALTNWRAAVEDANLENRTTVLSDIRVTTRQGQDAGGSETIASAHGSFDNDIAVVTRTLERITGGPLSLPVDDLRGF